MTTAGTRGTDRSAERARILEAGYRVLAASSGTAVPITEILSSAGLSTRAFYRHFDSKDALLLAMFRRDSDRVLAELRSHADRASSARDALAGWIDGMLGLAADPRRRARALVLISDQVTHAKGYRAEQERYHAGQDEVLTGILRRGLLDGAFQLTNPEGDAPFIRAALHQTLAELWSRQFTRPSQDVCEQLRDFVSRAVGARDIVD